MITVPKEWSAKGRQIQRGILIPRPAVKGPEGILRLDYGKNVPMPRELLWLENTLCGLGSACAWIIAHSLHETSGRQSVEVKEAFNKHECEKFPRILRKAPGGR